MGHSHFVLKLCILPVYELPSLRSRGHQAVYAGDVRTQEEVLLKCQGLAEKADYATLKAQILPRCQRLNLATTSASVRQASFKAMTALAPRFDKEVASEFIATTQQVRPSLITKFFVQLLQCRSSLGGKVLHWQNSTPIVRVAIVTFKAQSMAVLFSAHI